ncbi:MAG: TonB-dependent receptor [Ignavibacteria bacterium]|nr:TonB-dependent receptor [Ignavibacteria bacterium]
MKYIWVLLLCLGMVWNITAQVNTNQKNVIKNSFVSGEVLDVTSGEGISGATVVVIESPKIGAVTDTEGRFRIMLPTGAYSLKISAIGYQPLIKTDVIVNSGRECIVTAKMQTTTMEMQSVTVKGDYFDKAIQANNLSTIVLSAEEIRRSPGSAQDFQRILQSMPGVGFSSDMNNELLVRGGSPNENLVVFDDFEIHSINHYPNEMNSGGPINMVNVDLIEDIQFVTGGFTSKYGDKLSSVVLVNTREGRRNASLAGNINLSMAGAGTILEGGFGNGKGSWLFSARKSYLDLIVNAIGMTAVPKYYDGQYKITYDISEKHKLSFSGIYGNDAIDIKGDPSTDSYGSPNATYYTTYSSIVSNQYQYAVGGSVKSIWEKDFFTTFTLFNNRFNSDVDVINKLREEKFDRYGTLYSSRIASQSKRFARGADEEFNSVKLDAVWLATPGYELNFGGSIGSGAYKSNTNIYADTTRYKMPNGKYTYIIDSSSAILDDYNMFDQFKIYNYINNKFKLFDERLLLNIGLRYDYFTYSKVGNWSPRFSLTYYFIPQVMSMNLAYGYFYQTQAYPTYGDRYGQRINRYLDNTRAIHYVAGFEYVIADGLKLNIETYYKKYDRIPIDSTFINFDDKMYRSQYRVNIGKQYSYGIDCSLQQKLVSDIYGSVTFSYMKSRMEDPRIGHAGQEFPAEYEFPYLFTVIIGKRIAEARKWLDDSFFLLKYPSYLLPFSNDMEISVKWRYASGMNYTPKIYTRDINYLSQVIWNQGMWIDGDQINSSRYPDYHRLDIALNSRYNFTNFNLVVFFSIQNVYNRQNIEAYSYSSDGKRENVYQFSLLPILGIEAEF